MSGLFFWSDALFFVIVITLWFFIWLLVVEDAESFENSGYYKYSYSKEKFTVNISTFMVNFTIIINTSTGKQDSKERI
jgi:hypothetical protein